jgi:hypothetical protein
MVKWADQNRMAALKLWHSADGKTGGLLKMSVTMTKKNVKFVHISHYLVSAFAWKTPITTDSERMDVRDVNTVKLLRMPQEMFCSISRTV